MTVQIADVEEKTKRVIRHYSLPDTEIIRTLVWMSLVRHKKYFNTLKDYNLTMQQIKWFMKLNNI